MTTWAEAVPGWVVPPARQVADAYRMADALVDANGSEQAKGVVLVLGWLVSEWQAPITVRTQYGPVTRELAGEESWVALCEAAGQAPSERELARLGLVPQRAATGDDAERAYGVWRTLSWLLGTRADPPVELPERLADGSLADAEPRYTLPAGSAAWEAAQARLREQQRAEALRWWRHRSGLGETAGGG